MGQSNWVNAYDALLLAALEHGAIARAIGQTGVERRAFACFQSVEVAQTVAANDATYAVTAGDVVGEHSDRLGLDHFRPDPAPVARPGQLAVDNASRYSFKRDAAGNREAALLP